MVTAQRSVPATLELYPEMSYTDAKGKVQTERANKYFIMYGEEGEGSGKSINERRSARHDPDHVAVLQTLILIRLAELARYSSPAQIARAR